MYSNFEDGQSGCEGIPFYSSIKGDIEVSYPNLRNISDNILRALCFIYKKKRSRQNNFDQEYCSYLYYWLGDKIYPLVNDEVVFSRIINMIYGELYSNIAEDFIICNPLNTHINRDIFFKNKMLFDYSKDYKNIDLDTLHGQTTCNKDYKDYMEKYISMYKGAYLDCKGEKKNFDCKYFSTLFQENQYSKLSSFSCKQRDNIGVMLDKSKALEDQEPEPVQSYHQTTLTPPFPHHIPARDADLVKNQHTRGQTFSRAFEHPQMDDTTEGGTSKTIAGSVAPVLGVSSISLLLYKLTPVGGYINRLLGRNRNMYNPAEYMDSFNPYSDGMDPGGRTMNISYHRL
ncbi:hypothetical protein PVBG_06219 [Plasmodium vivax Brazil I]|uniref:VIR protein n=1 Tax=Plasmodium vivax (strain Brazil I) TaxID=1033975 RepID=A0A0J9VNM2_PLAV1|nr:hypothetical protein PVBG_06219 [Plasmodium vivax Brazil I]